MRYQVVVHLRCHLNIRLKNSEICILKSEISSVLCFSVTHSPLLCLLPLLYFPISGSCPHHDIILLFLPSPNLLLSFTFLLSLFRFFSFSLFNTISFSHYSFAISLQLNIHLSYVKLIILG